MIEIRKHPDITTALYISDLGMKLPEDLSWVPISDRFSADQIESSKNLAEALKSGLIEMRIQGDTADIPSWYLELYSAVIRIPTELLEDDVSSVIENLHRLQKDAHPVMWLIIRSSLAVLEQQGMNRSNIINTLMS